MYMLTHQVIIKELWSNEKAQFLNFNAEKLGFFIFTYRAK